jgi:hypothetical protein
MSNATSLRILKVIPGVIIRSASYCTLPMGTCRRNCSAPNDLRSLMEIFCELQEYAAAGSSYVAYSGRFFVDETKKSLSHEMAVSFFPNWFGQRQVRLVEVNGERLQLRTEEPVRLHSVLKMVTLTWRRAKPN